MSKCVSRTIDSAVKLNVFRYCSYRSFLLIFCLHQAAIIGHFHLDSPKPYTLRTIHSQMQRCCSCGATAVASFSIAYTKEDSDEVIMHTFIPDETQQKRGF